MANVSTTMVNYIISNWELLRHLSTGGTALTPIREETAINILRQHPNLRTRAEVDNYLIRSLGAVRK